MPRITDVFSTAYSGIFAHEHHGVIYRRFMESGIAECGLAQIIGGDWSYTVLRKQSFQKLDLSNICFNGTDLTECHFNQCKMNGCEFIEAIAYKTSFYKSDMRHSSLASFNILEANFRQAKLNLEQCVLIAEYLTEGRYTPDEMKKQRG